MSVGLDELAIESIESDGVGMAILVNLMGNVAEIVVEGLVDRQTVANGGLARRVKKGVSLLGVPIHGVVLVDFFAEPDVIGRARRVAAILAVNAAGDFVVVRVVMQSHRVAARVGHHRFTIEAIIFERGDAGAAAFKAIAEADDIAVAVEIVAGR